VGHLGGVILRDVSEILDGANDPVAEVNVSPLPMCTGRQKDAGVRRITLTDVIATLWTLAH
jgi:hypothetical protein